MTEPHDGGPGQRRRRRWFFGVWGALLLFALVLFRGVLLPFVLAIVVAYVLAPLVTYLERIRLGARVTPRWAAVLALYMALLGALSLFVALGVPRLAAEVERLAHDAPAAVQTVRDRWIPAIERTLRSTMVAYEDTEGVLPEPAPLRRTPLPGAMDAGVPSPEDHTPNIRVLPLEPGGYEVELPKRGIVVAPEGDRYRITSAADEVGRGGDLSSAITENLRRLTENTGAYALAIVKAAQSLGKAIVRGIFGFFLMLMLSAYLLITRDPIFAFARSLVRPSRRASFDHLLERIDRGLSGVVRGQLLICLVNGVLSGIGFYLLDLPYWPILTLIATVLSIIPIFGAILSSVPAVLVALQQGMMTAVLVLAWIVGVHQIEANLLNPKIMGDAARVHPVLVIFALLAGEHIYGIAGALLAVPVLSVVQSLFLHYKDVALEP